MLTFICKEEKGVVVEAMVIGDKQVIKKMYGDESSLTIHNNACIDIDISEEYAEDGGEEYTYDQINVTMPLNKIVKTNVHNEYRITSYFFRDFGHVIITDNFKHIRLATT